MSGPKTTGYETFHPDGRHREVLREEKPALLARKSPEAKQLVREFKELSK